MEDPNLKVSHPQKYYLRMICKGLYYVGLGRYWYERQEPKYPKILYVIWAIITNGAFIVAILDETFAYLKGDLTNEEKSEVFQYAFGHLSVALKFMLLYMKKDLIANVLRNIVEDNRRVFMSIDLERASVKKAKMICYTYIAVAYFAILTATLDGIRNAIVNGVPVRIVATYYPQSSQRDIFANIFRFFFIVHYWFFVTMMTLTEVLCFSCLVFVGFKFKLLQLYFKSRREKFLQNSSRRRDELEEEFVNDMVTGLKLHEDTLWCARNVQDALGKLYGIQVCQCILLLAVTLVKMVTSEDVGGFWSCISYIVCLVFLTACYMLPSGDITYEASRVSTALFQSGWELHPTVRVRKLLVVAIQRSQVPVCMTAFGVVVLSHENLINVLRSSYSLVAIMYK